MCLFLYQGRLAPTDVTYELTNFKIEKLTNLTGHIYKRTSAVSLGLPSNKISNLKYVVKTFVTSRGVKEKLSRNEWQNGEARANNSNFSEAKKITAQAVAFSIISWLGRRYVIQTFYAMIGGACYGRN